MSDLVKLIRESYYACSPKNRSTRSFRVINDILPSDRERIADLIEQQAKEIELLKIVIGENDIEQLQKYAGLGRLAIDITDKLHCKGEYGSAPCMYVLEIVCNRGCHLSDFCRKRAEILAEV